MVVPRASYLRSGGAVRHDAILVLQRGANASTDYYLRPRLRGEGRCEVVDIQSPPSRCGLLAPDGPSALFVIVCRYASSAWLDALEAARHRLARVAFFMDDDLPEMIRDAALPLAARGKVASHFGEHVDRLGALASEIWVSTPILAERYAASTPMVLTPAPEDDPPEPSREPPRRVVYHGADVHARERRFVVATARILAELDPGAVVEITGDAALRSVCRGLGNVEITQQLPWPDYLLRQQGARAAIGLAPLADSAVNRARAPVKAFDAARLGAAGVFADVEPFRSFVRGGVDGMLLPMDPQVWAVAIAALLNDPDRRLALARTARSRLVALRAEAQAFPPQPQA